MKIKNLIAEYKNREPEIKKRLGEFALVREMSDKDIFRELCFCILTANANALKCDEAIRELSCRRLLFKGPPRRLRPVLKGRVRFHNKKALFLTGARRAFKAGGKFDIKKRLNPKDVIKTREWLVGNIKGLGYKEASHFLRNIGLGRDIAILDRHILKNLKNYRVIDKVPPSLGSRKVYVAIEDKMRHFSRKTGIHLDALDLLFWSLETGFVFK